jgi:hypothetical protein
MFTRAIEFRQETIYFLIVDRFNDGNKDNNPGPNPELYDPTNRHGVNIGVVILKGLSTSWITSKGWG